MIGCPQYPGVGPAQSAVIQVAVHHRRIYVHILTISNRLRKLQLQREGYGILLLPTKSVMPYIVLATRIPRTDTDQLPSVADALVFFRIVVTRSYHGY
jgi:hypothetical protein